MNDSRTKNSVKHFLGAYQSVKFLTVENGEVTYLGDVSGVLEVRSTCQSLHFVKIPEIKSISQPLMIVDRNLHPLTKSVNRRLQEELAFPEKNIDVMQKLILHD